LKSNQINQKKKQKTFWIHFYVKDDKTNFAFNPCFFDI